MEAVKDGRTTSYVGKLFEKMGSALETYEEIEAVEFAEVFIPLLTDKGLSSRRDELINSWEFITGTASAPMTIVINGEKVLTTPALIKTDCLIYKEESKELNAIIASSQERKAKGSMSGEEDIVENLRGLIDGEDVVNDWKEFLIEFGKLDYGDKPHTTGVPVDTVDQEDIKAEEPVYEI